MDNDTIERIANAIVARIQPTNEMWSTEEIAKFLRLSTQHVRDRTVKSPGFPAGFEVPGAGTGKHATLRWRRTDIERWANPTTNKHTRYHNTR